MKKKSMALLLAMLMLSSTVACSDTTNKEETKSSATNTTDTGTTSENTDTDNLSDYDLRQQIPDDLPDTTFGGKAFRVMAYEGTNYVSEILVDEITGDACNDAVYNRNLDIESRFDVTIECTPDSGPWNTVKTMATAGTDDFDIVGIYNYMSYSPINAKAVLNWMEVPHVNLEKPWHNKLANGNATINNRLYAICSDLAISSMTYTYAVFFNIDMTTNYGYPSSDLYALVKEGKWTIDKMIEVTSEMYEDVNGNGEADSEDVFGFGYCVVNPADVWLAAFDQSICSVTEDNTLELSFMSDKTVSILEKLLDWHYNNKSFSKLTTQYDEEKYFLNSKLVMAPLRFYAAYNTLREMNAPYSMIPYPKWDEAQESYYTNADDKFTAFVIPITAYSNLDFVGTIYEVLCAESYKKVYPEYYDTALKGKYSSEPETAEMVDLIMSGRNFDFTFQFGESHFQRLCYMIRDMINNNDAGIASKYQKIEKALNKTIKNKLMPLYTD